MPKVNLYLPDELAFAVRSSELPLSSICQDALRAALARVSAREADSTDVRAIAARLLLTDHLEDHRKYIDGYEAGAEWARTKAHLRELRSLVRRSKAEIVVVDVSAIAPTLIGFLLERYPDLEPSPDWFDELDTDRPFERGLVEGATNTYDTVAPYLEEPLGRRK